jgi:DNA-binding MarR family transcriptional regulator
VASDSLTWALHDLAAATAEVDAAVARRMGLAAGDFLALKHLVVAAGPLGPVELGRMLGITSGAATGLVDRLERAGYARRDRHAGDRRRLAVSATPGARERIVRELRPLADAIDRAAASLDAGRRDAVAEILGSVAALHRRHARGPV